MKNDWKEEYEKPVTDNEYEICADCGVQTDIRVDTPITYRKLKLYGRTGESEDTIL